MSSQSRTLLVFSGGKRGFRTEEQDAAGLHAGPTFTSPVMGKSGPSPWPPLPNGTKGSVPNVLQCPVASLAKRDKGLRPQRPVRLNGWCSGRSFCSFCRNGGAAGPWPLPAYRIASVENRAACPSVGRSRKRRAVEPAVGRAAFRKMPASSGSSPWRTTRGRTGACTCSVRARYGRRASTCCEPPGADRRRRASALSRKQNHTCCLKY
ncbi:Uncharacterised protein [Slackia heliotrinireducens]|nr:Uncharacterised protein [Slackia heliotrinireducens]